MCSRSFRGHFSPPLMKELLQHRELEVIHMPTASFARLLELWIGVRRNLPTEGKQLSVAAGSCCYGVLHTKCQYDEI